MSEWYHTGLSVPSISPSTWHVKNSGVFNFYRRYLLQKCMSVFKWTMPETWDADYLLYNLYINGFVAVLDTKKWGVIPQHCTVSGYNVYRRPTTAVITNPAFSKHYELTIGKDCEIIKIMPDYVGMLDIVDYYAMQMALTASAASTNILNSRLAYVFGAENKASAETFKKMFDNIQSGEPAVFTDKNLFRSDGSQGWSTFSQNVGQNYIADRLLSDLRRWEMAFNIDIGIPDINSEKKERFIEAEATAMSTTGFTRVDYWEDTINKCLEKVNAMFGLTLSIERRVGKEVEPDASYFEPERNLSE